MGEGFFGHRLLWNKGFGERPPTGRAEKKKTKKSDVGDLWRWHGLSGWHDSVKIATGAHFDRVMSFLTESCHGWHDSVTFDRTLSTCQGGVTFWHPPDTLTDICEIGVWFLMELDSIFYGELNGAIGFEIRYVESNFRSVLRQRILRRIFFRTPWGGVIGSGLSNTVCSAYFYDSNAV
jgi:hypothetical protein